MYVIPRTEAAEQRASTHTSGAAREDALQEIYFRILFRCSPYARGALRECYYARGITVYPGWRDPDTGPESFYESACLWERGLQLDRVDNNEGYWPGNLRWVTPKENVRNRRVTNHFVVEGEALTMGEVCDRLGCPFPRKGFEDDAPRLPAPEGEIGPNWSTVCQRLYKGVNTWAELAAPLTRPRRKTYIVSGEEVQFGEILERSTQTRSVLTNRVRVVPEGGLTWEYLNASKKR